MDAWEVNVEGLEPCRAQVAHAAYASCVGAVAVARALPAVIASARGLLPSVHLRYAMPARRKTARWSKYVTEHSNALDLEDGVFTRSPAEIARSLKRSAECSKRRKSSPYRSAMSMLTFYQNRAGRNLSAKKRETIRKAKDELRKLFDREVTR